MAPVVVNSILNIQQQCEICSESKCAFRNTSVDISDVSYIPVADYSSDPGWVAKCSWINTYCSENIATVNDFVLCFPVVIIVIPLLTNLLQGVYKK